MNIKERLQILQSAGTISQETGTLMIQIIDRTESKWHLILTEENASALLTHLAMARERILKGEIAAPLDAAIFEEIKSSPDYEHAVTIVHDWNGILGNLLPEAETGYLLLHLCTLLGQEENKC